MNIKDELVLHGMTWAAEDDIEYNIIGSFQTSDSNTPVYYTVLWTGNAYTLQEKYACHVSNPTVIITEGGIVCPAKFTNPMRKPSYWCHDPDEAIPVIVRLKQVVMPYIGLIQDNNTTNNFP